MTMQVNLREFANLKEEKVLLWLGHRIRVEVTDDFDKKAFSDTFALMLSWQGYLVHRQYPAVKFSVDALVPSNDKKLGKAVVYNDDALCIPLEEGVEGVLEVVDDPMEVDNVKRLIHIWQTKIHNLSVVMGRKSMISATDVSVAELKEDPGIIEIQRKVDNKEVSIDEGEELFKGYVLDAPSLDYNTVALMARTGGVSINQAYQLAIKRGGVFDLNNGILPNAVESNYSEGVINATDAMGDSRSAGKAEVVTNLIKIPGGWKKMGDLQIGDQVVAHDGTYSTITHVHPQGSTKVLRVHFVDSRYVDVSPEHLWKVHKRNWLKDVSEEDRDEAFWRICTTQQLVDMLGKTTGDGGWFYIPLCTPEASPDKEFEIHPYVMGVLLGDGSFSGRHVEITKPYQQLLDKVKTLLPDHLGCNWKPSSGKTFSITYKKGTPYKRGDTINFWHPRMTLAKFKLMGTRSWEKFIPDEYLEGSPKQRLEVLQGLMDTDGTICNKGCISFSSSSELLAKGVQHLVRSLGGTARITTRTPHYTVNGKRLPGRTDHRVWIRHPHPKSLFTLDHKFARANAKTLCSEFKLRITSIEERPDEETKCITIDHPDHLYLTKDFIVTHNSLNSNGKALKDSEWFHRRTHLATAVMRSIGHMEDCGSMALVPIKIASREVALSLRGKYHALEDGSIAPIDRHNVVNIQTGDTVYIRSVATCGNSHRGQPCGVCYGRLKSVIPYNAMMRKDSNIGMFASTTICNPIGQKMLSTKHFIRNAVTKEFHPSQRDAEIITSNGNDIFLKKALCRPGTKLLLKSEVVKYLSDLRSLDNLDNLNMSKIPYFQEAAFIYEVEDIMMGGMTTQQHAVMVSVSSRHAHFSMGFLEYILKHGWTVQDKRSITIDLSEWISEEPLLTLPFTREDLDVHRARVENFLTFNTRNNMWKRQSVTSKIFGETLSEFWNLINQETKGVNVVYLEVILASLLTKDPENLSYGLGAGPGDKYFSSFSSCIEARGAGTLMIYESQQQTLNKAKTFMMKDRVASPLETFFKAAVS